MCENVTLFSYVIDFELECDPRSKAEPYSDRVLQL